MNPPRQIVIVGGGTAGWMTAAALSRFLPNGWRVSLVESDEIGTIGVGEATIPQLRLFLNGLGLDEDAFLADTQGSFKLGIRFEDWLRPGHSYLHSFAPPGPGLGLISFHHYWLRARNAGWAKPLEEYSANTLAAAQNRFTRASPDPRLRTPALAYAYHIDASRLARSLRRYAEARGVARCEGRVVDTELQADDGAIAAVRLEDGRRLPGELFIDCSGFRALLLGEALGVGFEDWSHWLPCDRAVAAPIARGAEPLAPYTRATALCAGWRWRIPLQQRTGCGYVYSSAHRTEQAALDELLGGLGAPPMTEPRLLRFRTGKRRRFWVKNCIAIGLAAGFMEPLESTSIHLVQSAIARLLQLLPDRYPSPLEAAAFDRQTHFEYDRIRDFLILHYKATERADTPFWRSCGAMDVPDSLTERLELFAASGRVMREHDELFTEASWLQVMIGQGITPRSWSPLAEQLDATALRDFLDGVRERAQSAVAAMPLHEDHLHRAQILSPSASAVS